VAPVDRSSGCRPTVTGGPVPAGHERSQTLDTGTVKGTYLLSVPRSYRSPRPTPLILLFYGFDSDPTQFSALTDLPARGAGDGYLVAVPHTQAGESEWQFSGHGTDATFVDGVVSSIERSYCVDTAAVFAAGFSAGAAFTIAYACTHQKQIRAIATVAVEFQLGCTRPLSILAFHGTKDPLVPYQNGAIGLSLPGIKVRGTELNMGDWARLDHCRAAPRVTRIGSQVVRRQWSGCAPGTAVGLYTILGGGHSWPGADPTKAIGLTTEQINATSLILSFFTRARG
jgi:polyhydroxybutyrate depolymerase